MNPEILHFCFSKFSARFYIIKIISKFLCSSLYSTIPKEQNMLKEQIFEILFLLIFIITFITSMTSSFYLYLLYDQHRLLKEDYEQTKSDLESLQQFIDTAEQFKPVFGSNDIHTELLYLGSQLESEQRNGTNDYDKSNGIIALLPDGSAAFQDVLETKSSTSITLVGSVYFSGIVSSRHPNAWDSSPSSGISKTTQDTLDLQSDSNYTSIVVKLEVAITFRIKFPSING